MSTRILVVDDEDEIRALVRRTLAGEHVELVEAADGRAALAAAAADAPDLVVLDWQMPGMSGPEVLTELKRRSPTTPVILLTAALGPSYGGLATTFGADSFLMKPFRPADLTAEVERLLATRRAPR